MSALPDSLVASTFVAIVSIDWPLVYSHLNGYELLQIMCYLLCRIVFFRMFVSSLVFI
mgnify:CR=1 FL=1